MGKKRNRWKDLVTGIAGGAVGLVAMRAYWQRVAPRLREQVGEQVREQIDGKGGTELYPRWLDLDRISLVGRKYKKNESSTEAMGRIVYSWVTGKEPESEEARTMLSYLTHWWFGLMQGGTYGLSSGNAAFPDVGGGLAHGARLWLFADEMMVPMLGLQGGPTAAPPLQHANRLGAHLFYGVAAAAATQFLRWLF